MCIGYADKTRLPSHASNMISFIIGRVEPIRDIGAQRE